MAKNSVSRHVAEQFFGPAGKPTHSYDPAGQPWMRDGLCRYMDPDMFFPEKMETGRQAKRICRVCPVRDECLVFAMSHPRLQGIWGGTNERDRQRLRMTVREGWSG